MRNRDAVEGNVTRQRGRAGAGPELRQRHLHCRAGQDTEVGGPLAARR